MQITKLLRDACRLQDRFGCSANLAAAADNLCRQLHDTHKRCRTLVVRQLMRFG